MNRFRFQTLLHPALCIPAAILFACLATAALCRASCRIELENGAAFVAPRYRVENGLVQFAYCSGRIRIPLQGVAAIQDCGRMPPAGTIQRLPPPTCFHIKKPPSGDSPGNFADTVRQYKKAFDRNREKIREQRQIFQRAKSRNARQARDKAWERLGEFKKARMRLRRRVIRLYKGTLPEWWEQ